MLYFHPKYYTNLVMLEQAYHLRISKVDAGYCLKGRTKNERLYPRNTAMKKVHGWALRTKMCADCVSPWLGLSRTSGELSCSRLLNRLWTRSLCLSAFGLGEFFQSSYSGRRRTVSRTTASGGRDSCTDGKCAEHDRNQLQHPEDFLSH